MRELFYRKGYQSDFVFDWTIMNYQQDFYAGTRQQTQIALQQVGQGQGQGQGQGSAQLLLTGAAPPAVGGKEAKDSGEVERAVQERNKEKERLEEKAAAALPSSKQLKPEASVAVTSHLGPGTINTGLGLLSSSLASPVASPSSNMATPGYTPQGSPHFSSLSPSPVNGSNPVSLQQPSNPTSIANPLQLSSTQIGLPGGQPSQSSGSAHFSNSSPSPLISSSSAAFQRRNNPRRAKGPDSSHQPGDSQQIAGYPPSSPPPLPHIDQQTMEAFSRLTTRPEPAPPAASSPTFVRSSSGGQQGGFSSGPQPSAQGGGASSPPIYGTRVSKPTAPLALSGASAVQGGGPSSATRQQSSGSGGGKSSREQ